MTPKEKANELLSKFVSISLSQYVDLVDGIRIRLAKKCALITVDEILNMEILKRGSKLFDKPRFFDQVQYWEQVKEEIINL